MSLRQNRKELMIKALTQRACVYNFVGKNESALIDLNKALNLAKKIDNKEYIAEYIAECFYILCSVYNCIS